jgi:hypothetical protein
MYYYYTIDYNWQKKTKKQTKCTMYICCSTGYIITWIEAFKLSIEWIFPHTISFCKIFFTSDFCGFISLGQQKHVDTLNVMTLFHPSVISYGCIYIGCIIYTPVTCRTQKYKKKRFCFFLGKKSERCCCASKRVTHRKNICASARQVRP